MEIQNEVGECTAKFGTIFISLLAEPSIIKVPYVFGIKIEDDIIHIERYMLDRDGKIFIVYGEVMSEVISVHKLTFLAINEKGDDITKEFLAFVAEITN